ncbi:uncharacterized protein LOC116142022 [Pistacia vera]|uniref:uncharacterized protein LOC116142022 n=1 Tax=Pistacia vera TaxID=55513 RepID=UPI001262D7AB|nr:uncharacterized protein LOC116142022 [Pistacia vera]XP_031283339.1 uncharacterized protein LOC116142022 [Pistacia vera]
MFFWRTASSLVASNDSWSTDSWLSKSFTVEAGNDKVLSGMGSQSQNVVHVLAALRNFTMSQKEKTLDELVQDNCLRYIEDDKIGLGVRYCLDLRSWFCNLDVPSCEVCNEVVLKGELCQTKGCLS